MAHLTSPTSFRLGKTFLSSSLNSNLDSLGFATGLEGSINSYLKTHNLLLIRSSFSNSEQLGLLHMHVLYYPIIRPQQRVKPFPKFFDFHQLINFKFDYSPNFRPTLNKLMRLKQNEFDNRHFTSKPKKNLNN